MFDWNNGSTTVGSKLQNVEVLKQNTHSVFPAGENNQCPKQWFSVNLAFASPALLECEVQVRKNSIEYCCHWAKQLFCFDQCRCNAAGDFFVLFRITFLGNF